MLHRPGCIPACDWDHCTCLPDMQHVLVQYLLLNCMLCCNTSHRMCCVYVAVYLADLLCLVRMIILQWLSLIFSSARFWLRSVALVKRFHDMRSSWGLHSPQDPCKPLCICMQCHELVLWQGLLPSCCAAVVHRYPWWWLYTSWSPSKTL